MADGPLEFPGEPAAGGKPDTAAILDINGYGYVVKIVGTGKALQDVDLVSFEEYTDTDRSKVCTGFKGGDVKLLMVDSTVRVYGRRSGELVKEQVFKAKDKCPSIAYVNKKDNSQELRGQESHGASRQRSRRSLTDAQKDERRTRKPSPVSASQLSAARA